MMYARYQPAAPPSGYVGAESIIVLDGLLMACKTARAQRAQRRRPLIDGCGAIRNRTAPALTLSPPLIKGKERKNTVQGEVCLPSRF